MAKIITIEFTVGVGYIPGDYAKLFGNSGSGAVDYNTPLTNQTFNLFPNGAGIYGFGHAPFGRFRFGHAHSMRAPGFGHAPFGHFPFGLGAVVITAKQRVTACGTYKFAFGCYDSADNPHTGTPEVATVAVHTAPDAPTGLKKKTYNKTTDVLTLEVAA